METTQSTEWTLHAGHFGEHPAVMRLRTAAFTTERGKPEYTTAIVVQVALNEPTDEGLTTNEEGAQLGDVEDLLAAVMEARALLVSVITGLGLRQWTYYTDRVALAPELLRMLDERVTTHGFRVLARPDPQWSAARQLLDE